MELTDNILSSLWQAASNSKNGSSGFLNFLVTVIVLWTLASVLLTQEVMKLWVEIHD